MKPILSSGALIVCAWLCCSCSTTSLKKTWKSPDYSGPQPVGKVALIAVDERPVVRQIFEGQFATQLEARGHGTVRTHEYLTLEEMKADRKVAAAKLRELGAETVLIVRLVNEATYARDVRATRSAYVPVTTGMDTWGWYTAFEVAFTDMGVTYGSVESHVFLESTLFDLASGKPIWSGVTRTVVKETTDRLEEVRPLVSMVMTAMNKDGVVRQ